MSARRAPPKRVWTKGVQRSWRKENCGPNKKVYPLPVMVGGRSLMRKALTSATKLNQRFTFPATEPVAPCQLKVSFAPVLVLNRTNEYPRKTSTAGYSPRSVAAGALACGGQ